MALNGNPEIENDKWLMTENDCAAAPRKKIKKVGKVFENRNGDVVYLQSN